MWNDIEDWTKTWVWHSWPDMLWVCSEKLSNTAPHVKRLQTICCLQWVFCHSGSPSKIPYAVFGDYTKWTCSVAPVWRVLLHFKNPSKAISHVSLNDSALKMLVFSQSIPWLCTKLNRFPLKWNHCPWTLFFLRPPLSQFSSRCNRLKLPLWLHTIISRSQAGARRSQESTCS